MKTPWSRPILSGLIAGVLLCIQHFGLMTNIVQINILIVVGLLMLLGYAAQFPLSVQVFEVQNYREKAIVFCVMSFANAVSIFIIPSLAAYIIHLTLFQLLSFYLFLFVIVSFIKRKSDINFVKDNYSDKMRQYKLLNILFWLSLIILIFLGFYYGCWISGDYTWHGSFLRKLREISPIPFKNYIVSGLPYPNYGHNAWHLFLAMLSFITGNDVGLIWVNSGLFITLIRVAVFYFLAKSLFKNSYWAQVSIIIFFMLYSLRGIEILGSAPLIEHKLTWDSVAYPSMVSREIFMFIALGFIFKGIYEKKIYKLEILAISLCITFTHFYYIFHLGFILGTMFLVSLLFKSEQMKYFRSSCIAYLPYLLPAIIYTLYYKQLLDTPTVNPYFLSPDLVGNFNNTVLFIKNKYPIINWWSGFLKNPFYAAAILSVIPVIYSLKDKTITIWKLFIIATTVSMAFIFFNPLLLYFLQKVNPGLDRIWRLWESLPVAFIFVGFLYYIQEEKQLVKKKALQFYLFICTAVLSPVFVRFYQSIGYNAGNWGQEVEKEIKYKNILEEYIEPGKNVFVDPKIAWTFTTMLPYYMYMHPLPVCIPPNVDPSERIKNWKSFFEKEVNEDTIKEIYNANMDYIILTNETYSLKYKELNKYHKYLENPIFVKGIGLVIIGLKNQEKRSLQKNR